MKKTELRTKTLKSLRTIALRLGIKRPSKQKDDLIAEIIAAEKIKGIKKARTKKGASKASKEKDSPILRKTIISRPYPDSRVEITIPSSPTQTSDVPKEENKFQSSSSISNEKRGSYDDLGELPESYGTGRLFFTARDPHWLYAYWDYTWKQLEEMRSVARNNDLKLRIYLGQDSKAPLYQEIVIHPPAHNWFIKVDQSNTEYYAEFGYEDLSGNYVSTSRSKPIRTPPDQISDHTEAQFVTIPFHIRFQELFEMVKTYFKEGEELAEALYRLQTEGFRFPFDYPKGKDMSMELSDDLNRLLIGDMIRLLRTGSFEVTHWLRSTSSSSS